MENEKNIPNPIKHGLEIDPTKVAKRKKKEEEDVEKKRKKLAEEWEDLLKKI